MMTPLRLIEDEPSPNSQNEPLLSGSLAHLSVADLLQSAATAQRTGTIRLVQGEQNGTLSLHNGEVVDARLDDHQGRDAALQLVRWETGTFEANFGSENIEESFRASPSWLLLESARIEDEARRRSEKPPFAALLDPPPTPPRAALTVHRALSLLSISSAYALHHLTEGLLAQRLESARRELLLEHEELAWFSVDDRGVVTWSPNAPELEEPILPSLVRAICRWLELFFGRAEHSLPGRFTTSRLADLTEAIRDDLEELGFLRELGLDRTLETT